MRSQSGRNARTTAMQERAGWLRDQETSSALEVYSGASFIVRAKHKDKRGKPRLVCLSSARCTADPKRVAGLG
jgi:hypothetical protein